MRTFAVVAALLLASCGGGDDDTEPPKRERGHGVVLTLDPDSPHVGEEMTLTIDNRTDERLEYGVAYRLERRTNGEWRWVNRDSAFILILKFIDPGGREREQIRLPGHLEPGRYRIVKSFRAPESQQELDASAEFRVSGL